MTHSTGTEGPGDDSGPPQHHRPAAHAASPRYPAHFGAIALLRADGTAAGTAPAHHLLRTRALPHSGVNPAAANAAAEPLSARLCEHFEGLGKCNRGARCRFAHRAGSPPPQVTPAPTMLACSRSMPVSCDDTSMSSSSNTGWVATPGGAAASASSSGQRLGATAAVPIHRPHLRPAASSGHWSPLLAAPGGGGGAADSPRPQQPCSAAAPPPPAPPTRWEPTTAAAAHPPEHQAAAVLTPFFVTLDPHQQRLQQHLHGPGGGGVWDPQPAAGGSSGGQQHAWAAPAAAAAAVASFAAPSFGEGARPHVFQFGYASNW